MDTVKRVKNFLSSERYADAVNRAVAWLASEQNEDGSYGDTADEFVDLAGYYKSCWAFARGGDQESGKKLVGEKTGDREFAPEIYYSEVSESIFRFLWTFMCKIGEISIFGLKIFVKILWVYILFQVFFYGCTFHFCACAMYQAQINH